MRIEELDARNWFSTGSHWQVTTEGLKGLFTRSFVGYTLLNLHG